MRTVRVFGGTAALMLVLVACGSGTGSGGENSGSDGAGPTTIEFSSHITGMDKVVKAFNKSHDDITVEFQQTPSPTEGGNAKLTNGIEAGNAPDVATVEYQDLPSFVSQGGLRPVGDLAGDVLEKVPDGISSSVTFGDEAWALPYDAAPLVFYYRADVYQDLGIDVPRTWEEFRRAAETIAEQRPGTAIASFPPNESKLFAGLAWQNRAQWFDTEGDTWHVGLDDKATTEVAEYWQGLIDDDLVRVEQGFSDEWANSLDTGRVVGYVGASWGASSLAERTASSAGKWRVAPLPAWDEPATAMYGGSAFAVTADSDAPEAAAEFASWLITSKEGFEARGDVGVAYPAIPSLLPAAKAAVSTEHFGGQDIYAVFESEAASIVEDWTWGPTLTTLTTLGDGLGRVGNGGTIVEAVVEAEQETVAEMENVGLKVEVAE